MKVPIHQETPDHIEEPSPEDEEAYHSPTSFPSIILALVLLTIGAVLMLGWQRGIGLALFSVGFIAGVGALAGKE